MNKILSVFIFLIILSSPVFAFIEDEFANSSLPKNLSKPEGYLEYDYNSTVKIPINLKLVGTVIRSEKDLYEGQILRFETVENVFYKNTLLLPKGTPVTSRVETIITNGMNGIPASVVLGNFQCENIKSTRLTLTYEKYGMDLSLLVFPIKWALTPLPPTGSLTNFIKGGHVKFRKNTNITIYYHPEWL